jgi:hypothetical protein
MGPPVERGYTGPPRPTALLSSGRDRQPAMTPKTLRHNTPVYANMRRNFQINCPVGGLSRHLPSRSREGYAENFPSNQALGTVEQRRQCVRLRITKIDEYQFLTCLKHGLWGSRSARFKTWAVGDRLAIIVEKSLAGL